MLYVAIWYASISPVVMRVKEERIHLTGAFLSWEVNQTQFLLFYFTEIQTPKRLSW